MDDINEIWGELSNHSGEALKQDLEEHKNKADEVDNTLVEEMINISSKIEKAEE